MIFPLFFEQEENPPCQGWQGCCQWLGDKRRKRIKIASSEPDELVAARETTLEKSEDISLGKTPDMRRIVLERTRLPAEKSATARRNQSIGVSSSTWTLLA